MEVHDSRRALGVYAALSLGFVAVGVGVVFASPEKAASWVIGGFGAGFFGVIAIGILKRMNRKGPALRLDDAGIWDDSSPFGSSFTPWAAISDVEITTYRGQSFVTLRIRDRKAFLAERSHLMRWVWRANAVLAGPGVHIATRGLDIDAGALCAVIRKWLAERR